VGKLLDKYADEYFREHIFLIAGALIVVGLLMWAGEKASRMDKPLTRISLLDALIVGCAQACALIPGVSRSGSTITAGLFRNMTREAAVRFSFLLSTPIIAGAALLKAHELHKEGLPHAMHAPFLVGILVSALVGYAAIAWLIRYLQDHSLKIFVIYRVVFGLVVIVLAYMWHLQ
jgi:undecaprenyl-diphosphatase